MREKEIPVLLLTGYLGSGKTTLVNHILANEKGIKFAVIVNDIGEVNIDADLIQKGGVVGKKDDSLVALQNGCICCTLKADLIEQINELLETERFDYIVIEASGICEPEPIAQTICSIPRLGKEYTRHGICRLDSITTVVDALRLQSEFACGEELTRNNIDEEDIENLVIQQIEFCNIILLNKASEVQPEELKRIRKILQTLQPGAEIIECDYANVALEKLIHTDLFNFERVATSAGWIRGIERLATEEEELEAHGKHHEHTEEDHEVHHHHHDNEDNEEHHHHHHHHPGGVDPHTWSSISGAKVIAKNTLDAFVSLDPENKEYYQANYEQLTKEIGETEKTVSGLLHSLDNKTFIIYHPALTYLANEYGLTQLCIEMDGKEPSPAQLKELVETAREHNAKVVFIQREFDQKNAELIAKETGCRLIPINPLDYDWSKEMIHIAKSLADGQAD